MALPDLIAQIHPHELSKAMLKDMNDLVRRISCAAVIKGRGNDLLLYIYLAGLYHGSELSNR